MQITIPDEFAEPLEQEAKDRNVTPQAVVEEMLRKRFPANGKHEPNNADNPESDKPMTLADLWADYIGCVSSKDKFPEGSDLSSRTGEAFKEILLEKHRRSQ